MLRGTQWKIKTDRRNQAKQLVAEVNLLYVTVRDISCGLKRRLYV